MYACTGPLNKAGVSNLLSYPSVAAGSVPMYSLFDARPVSDAGSGVETSKFTCQLARDIVVQLNISMVISVNIETVLCMDVAPPIMVYI